jgi:hypothetical protein
MQFQPRDRGQVRVSFLGARAWFDPEELELA